MRRIWLTAALIALPLVASAADGDLISAPVAGSIEDSIRGSLRMIRDNKFDDWMTTWCDPLRCSTEQQRDDLRRYGLVRAQKDAANCLHGKDDAIVIKRWRGDPTKDDTVTVYIGCEEGRLPVPSTHTRVDGKWKVASFSW
jgi:hypothetical protein